MGVVNDQIELDIEHSDPYARAPCYSNSTPLRCIGEGLGSVCSTMRRMGHSICDKINCAVDFLSKHDPKSLNSKDECCEQLGVYPKNAPKDDFNDDWVAPVCNSGDLLVNSDSTLYNHGNVACGMISQRDSKHEYYSKDCKTPLPNSKTLLPNSKTLLPNSKTLSPNSKTLLSNSKCACWPKASPERHEYCAQGDNKEECAYNEKVQENDFNPQHTEEQTCKFPQYNQYSQEKLNDRKWTPPCCLQNLETKNDTTPKYNEDALQRNKLFNSHNYQGLSDHRNKQELKSTPNPKYFEKIKKLGEGAYSNVYLLVDKNTKKKYISKHLNPELIWNLHNDPESKCLVPYEIHMLQELKKRNYKYSVECFGIYKYKSEYVLLMEYMGSNWVDMYAYISDFGPKNVREIEYVFLQVLDAVSYLHKIGITHNDIKDENIIIDYRTLQIKIIDFGSALVIKKTSLNKFYGTRRFASPQVITHSPYNQISQELWSLGALLFVFSYKMNPFNYEIDILRNDIYYQIQRAEYENSKKNNGFYITDNIKNTMAGLMQKNEKHRISVEQAKRLISME